MRLAAYSPAVISAAKISATIITIGALFVKGTYAQDRTSEAGEASIKGMSRFNTLWRLYVGTLEL